MINKLLGFGFFIGVALFSFPSRLAAGEWKLLYEETFDRPVNDTAKWVKDPLGKKSPWHVDSRDDDGDYFKVNGGRDFEKMLRTFDLYRKRLRFGEQGWLTAEFSARDVDKDGRPDNPPLLSTATLTSGKTVGHIQVPEHQGGLIIRPTKPLPSRYRVEMELVMIRFGGTYYNQWQYEKKTNGYEPAGTKTPAPWTWGPSDLYRRPPSDWPDVRIANGFYYLTIVDYKNPAPYNNVFIHSHRKVGIDAYNVMQTAGGYDTCNTVKKEYYPTNDNTINMIFFTPGDFSQSGGVTVTDCGVATPKDPGHSQFTAAGQIQPEIMPEETYRFAIERDETGYTLEAEGVFRFAGRKKLRYRRDFVQDGFPIWHYNQTPPEYDGAFNEKWTYKGPYGEITEESWPKGSAYPDYFVLGDPHENYYEGWAMVDDIKLFVPSN